MALPDNLNSSLNVYQAAAKYRARLLAREQTTVDDLTRRWIIARNSIADELYALIERVETALANGKLPGYGTSSDTFSVSLLFQIARAETVYNTITDVVNSLQSRTEKLVDARVASEAIQGVSDAKGLLAFRMRDDGLVVPRQFAGISQDALAEITAFVGPDGPKPEAFRGMADELVTALQQDLVNAVARGANGRTVAVEMKKTVARIVEKKTDEGGLLDRPLYEFARVAKTEPIRAYRTSGLATYKANSDVVLGWEWHTFVDKRTCAFCIAMDGTRHDYDESMATHPLCRCGQLPVTEFSDVPQFGAQAFLYNLTAKEQDNIFDSHTMGELYRSGKVDIEDIPVFKEHPKWGTTGHADSMTGLVKRGVITDEDILQASRSNTTVPQFAPPTPGVQRVIPFK